MNERQDTAERQNEGGDVELAQYDGGEFQKAKMNSADTLAGGSFPTKNLSDSKPSRSTMQKCFIGFTVFGCLTLFIMFIIIIAMIASDDSTEVDAERPPYHY